jgi:multidrug efflux pump subunit AcrB
VKKTQPLKKVYKNDGQDKLLSKLSLFVFDRPRTAAILWLCLAVFGVFSYTTWLKREGFPSVNIPYSIITGAYIVNDPAKVDHDVAKLIGEIALKDKRVKSVLSQAQGNFYSVVLQYDEGTDAAKAGKEIERRVKDTGVLPPAATATAEAPKFGFTERGDDGVVTVYAKQKGVPLSELVAEGEKVTAFIKAQKFADIESISLISPYVQGTDPATGQQVATQTKFDRYGERAQNNNRYFDSVAVGFLQKDGTDVIKLDDKLRAALDRYNREHKDSTFVATVSASYAPDIKDQISELQRALLEGLLAVLVIGSIVIAIRASLVTVLSMLTVLAITLGVLLTIGYTLNTITLFALILCLGLIVDDTIIMVEAIDAQRRKRKDPRETVRVATRKISRAMVAATSTAILSFAPLIFVGGILGSFIRAIPVTVITALAVSLLVALIFIPLFARYLLLGKKQMGEKNVHEPAAGIEAKVAAFVAGPMLWARNSKKKLFGVGIAAVLVGFGFIMAAGFIFQKVTFNIFPPSKDSNGLTVQLRFDPGTSIGQAEAIADKTDEVVARELGENFRRASYYGGGNQQNALQYVYLLPYNERDVTAPQLAEQLEKELKGLEGATVKIGQLEAGPPASAFAARIQTDDREAAFRLAKDIESFLTGHQLTRISGEKAKITSTVISDPGTYARAEGKSYIEVGASFDGTDTSTLVTLAQEAVEKEFTPEKLQMYGLDKDVLQFDFGQEEENQDSFKTLAIAFPILLLAIYILLAVQFRSLVQPLLIFMAIPFSLFGITLGLYLSDNAFSFFSMLGFFALIGLSIKNTILLTDYANQLRRGGASAIDAAVGALEERFRPLIATSLTAVVSLVPLTLASPFWQGVTMVLICGLLSSTFLVITVFPYYYLGVEYLRLRVSRKAGLTWLGLTIILSVGLIMAGASANVIPLIAIGIPIVWAVGRKLRRGKAA